MTLSVMISTSCVYRIDVPRGYDTISLVGETKIGFSLFILDYLLAFGGHFPIDMDWYHNII
jgi:hypothetical protein